MNKEAVIVLLDCNSTMGKVFASSGESDKPMAEQLPLGTNIDAPEPQTRF